MLFLLRPRNVLSPFLEAMWKNRIAISFDVWTILKHVRMARLVSYEVDRWSIGPRKQLDGSGLSPISLERLRYFLCSVAIYLISYAHPGSTRWLSDMNVCCCCRFWEIKLAQLKTRWRGGQVFMAPTRIDSCPIQLHGGLFSSSDTYS